jgi:hypothetical protein
MTANAEVATILGSIPASADTMESEGRQNETVLNKVHKKNPPVKKLSGSGSKVNLIFNMN